MTWPLQQPNDSAEAQPGDKLYDVSVSIPDIGGSSPEEAAEVFWRILSDWTRGAIKDPVQIVIKETARYNSVVVTHYADINPDTGEAR